MDDATGTTAGSGSICDSIRFDTRAPTIAPVASCEAMKVFVVGLEAGQELRRHRAPGELTLLLIEGEPVITVGDGSRAATRGMSSSSSRRAVVVGVLHEVASPTVPEHERQEEMSKSTPTADIGRLETLETLEDEAIDSNPDVETRRETFELELMEEGRSEEGAFADLANEERQRRSRMHRQGS